jgi:hypothetical protein
LWAAKQSALEAMGQQLLDVMVASLPAVFFIITINPLVAPLGGGRPRYTASRRMLPRGKSTGGRQTPGKPEPVKQEVPTAKAQPAKDPVALGRKIQDEVRALPKGKRATIAQRVTEGGLSQEEAVKATAEASQVFGRVGRPVKMPDGSVVVPSVQVGPNQPVFVISQSGAVQPARAVIAPSAPIDLKNPITITNIVLE